MHGLLLYVIWTYSSLETLLLPIDSDLLVIPAANTDAVDDPGVTRPITMDDDSGNLQ